MLMIIPSVKPACRGQKNSAARAADLICAVSLQSCSGANTTAKVVTEHCSSNGVKKASLDQSWVNAQSATKCKELR